MQEKFNEHKITTYKCMKMSQRLVGHCQSHSSHCPHIRSISISIVNRQKHIFSPKVTPDKPECKAATRQVVLNCKNYFTALLIFPPTQTTHNNANLFSPPSPTGVVKSYSGKVTNLSSSRQGRSR